MALLTSLLSWRFAAVEQGAPARHDGRIDGLRGFAALSVIFVHSLGDGAGGPVGLSNEYFRHLHLSRVAVMLFFITSGYVIGLTNRQPFTASHAWDYTGRRLLRIVPIYLIALGCGWLAVQSVPWTNLVANALFLQNLAWNIEVIPGNPPLWSLHYEMLYYGGFLLLWCWRPGVLALAAICLGLSAGQWFLGGFLAVPGSWAAGACFWLAGLLFAWHRPSAGSVPLISFLLLAYATDHLWPGIMLFNGLGLPNAGPAAVTLADLFLLPVCIVIFAGLLGVDFPGLRLLRWLAIAIPVGTCVLLGLIGRLGENAGWNAATLATAVGLALLAFERPGWGPAFIRWFRPLDPISYSLYVLHAPIGMWVSRFYPWHPGIINYLGGILVMLVVTFGLAWLLETKMQPALTLWYKRRRAIS